MMRKPRLHLVVVTLFWATMLALPSARAQYIMEFAQTYNAPMSNFISISAMNNTAMNTAAQDGKGGQAPAGASMGLRASSQPQLARNARTLALHVPEAQRPAMEKVYLRSFDVYRALEAKFSWQNDDLAGALAAFVVGNYMVMAQTDVRDEDFVAVADQLRRNRGMAAAFKSLSTNDVRAMYEQSAMVGAFMALAELSRKQQPLGAQEHANMIASARANLQQVLRSDPARLRIGPQGMRMD